jgi:hypothetical protein
MAKTAHRDAHDGLRNRGNRQIPAVGRIAPRSAFVIEMISQAAGMAGSKAPAGRSTEAVS